MTYDPTKPADRHNPLPMKQWPFPEGHKVWYVLEKNCPVQVAKGVVRFYNPATHGSMWVTEGKPFFNIDGNIVEKERVFNGNPAGLKAARAYVSALFDRRRIEMRKRHRQEETEMARLMGLALDAAVSRKHPCEQTGYL